MKNVYIICYQIEDPELGLGENRVDFDFGAFVNKKDAEAQKAKVNHLSDIIYTIKEIKLTE